MITVLEKELGREIRRARQERGMTQKGVAAGMQLLGADLTENRIRKIEGGMVKISVPELFRFSCILELDLNALAFAYCINHNRYDRMEDNNDRNHLTE